MSSADRREIGATGLGSSRYGRRHFLKLVGGTAATVMGGAYLLGDGISSVAAADPYATYPKKFIQFVATDGFVTMPSQASPVEAIWPDNLAPADRDLYIFGFASAEISGRNGAWPTPGKFWSDSAATFLPMNDVGATPGVINLAGKAELSAPMLWFNEGDDVRIQLWNLGLTQRPDLLDAHTIHWHGFPNQIPYFDGVPDSSLSVPPGRNLWYRYIVRQPGSFMYHCHVEDVEHVHMGLTGIVFIHPSQIKTGNGAGAPIGRLGGNLDPLAPMGYVFNDGVATTDPMSTKFDREFAFILTEADVRDHWNDAHKQENDFTDYAPYFGVMNGRSYPDTLVGNRPDYMPGTPNPYPARLHANPWSSVVEAREGETVLLRFSDLGFEEHSIVLPGLEMWVVGRDSEQLTPGRPGFAGAALSRGDATWRTDRIDIGPGESRDVLVKVPTGTAGKVYDLYDRMDRFANDSSTLSTPGTTPGSMRTEFRIYDASLPLQTWPHQSFRA